MPMKGPHLQFDAVSTTDSTLRCMISFGASVPPQPTILAPQFLQVHLGWALDLGCMCPPYIGVKAATVLHRACCLILT